MKKRDKVIRWFVRKGKDKDKDPLYIPDEEVVEEKIIDDNPVEKAEPVEKQVVDETGKVTPTPVIDNGKPKDITTPEAVDKDLIKKEEPATLDKPVIDPNKDINVIYEEKVEEEKKEKLLTDEQKAKDGTVILTTLPVVEQPEKKIDERTKKPIEENLFEEKSEAQEDLDKIFSMEEQPEQNLFLDDTDIDKNISIPDEILLKTAVLDEIEKMLKSDYYDIKSIKYELDILSSKERDEVLLAEVEKIERRLQELINRFNEIKRKYDYLYSTMNIDQVKNFGDGYINSLVGEYKNSVKAGENPEASLLQIKNIEEYITIINEMIVIEKEKDVLSTKVEEKKEKFEMRDDEFLKLKDNYAAVDSANDYIKKFSADQDEMVRDLEAKVRNSENITRTIEYRTEVVTSFSKIFAATMMMAAATNIAPTPIGNIMKLGLVIGAVGLASNATKSYVVPDKTIDRISYTDYSRDIAEGLSNINSVVDMSDKAVGDIRAMKTLFEHEFSEYANQIPEYGNMMKSLDSLEKELEFRKQKALEYESRLEKDLNENNIKMKKLANN